jgi:hypothetical protein
VSKKPGTLQFSFLILSSHAMELWVQATNGISWLPAVFFSVQAIALAHRGRPGLAYLAAALGCLCFGAAFPVWFALTLVLWLRKAPRLTVAAPAAIGVLVLGVWFATKPSGGQSLATTAFDPDGRLSTMAAAVGGLWSADLALPAIIAGGLTITALALLAATTIQRSTAQGTASAATGGAPLQRVGLDVLEHGLDVAGRDLVEVSLSPPKEDLFPVRAIDTS